MYIKQVIIQGFKSFRDQTVIDPFDPRHNVVVGRNGSGKTNFFYAIQFVLSDEFSFLRPEQRHALLHEGSGPRVISAYVEIIFDNSDGRLPIDRDEVFLRRVIGSKKDQYFVNKKVVPRSDVMNLLESAGFSRSNPYYIVKQGKINQIATAPDSHRLKLLREVAGTRVYDERREESKALIKESRSKREKVDEFLRIIEDRLSALEEEKDELREYQKWDKMRRSLEYTIHDRELKDARRKLDELEKLRGCSGEEQNRKKTQLKRAEENVQQTSKRLKELKVEEAAIADERDALNAENQQLLAEKARLELGVRDLHDQVNGDNSSKERAQVELNELNETLKQKEAELAAIEPRYEELKQKEDELNRELSRTEQLRQELYARQGRASQFSSRQQRDGWIRAELKSLEKQLKAKRHQIERLTEELAGDSDNVAELKTRVEEITVDMGRYRDKFDEQNRGCFDLRREKEALHARRNELWRRESALRQTASVQRDDLQRQEQTLRSMVGRPTLLGADSLSRVLETFRQRAADHQQEGGGAPSFWQRILDGYCGQVVDLFTCDPAIYTAVEVTAGNKLFNHVVKTDEVGSQILKEMNKQSLPGEVTFMPLNRLVVKDIEYPKTENAFPMVSRLSFDDNYDLAMRFVFGRTLICRSLETATHLARAHRLDCVTIDGDQVMSKGSVTGGYCNPARSRLDTHRLRNQLLSQLASTQQQLESVAEQLGAVELQINGVMTEMQRAETRSGKARDVFDQMRTDERLLVERLASVETVRRPKERGLASLKCSLDAMLATRNSLRSELQQELMTSFSTEDQRHADQLADTLRRLRHDCRTACEQRVRVEGERSRLDHQLANNLRRRRDQLQQALQEVSVEERRRQLEHSRAELVRCTERQTAAAQTLNAAELKMAALLERLADGAGEQEIAAGRLRHLEERMLDDTKRLELLATRQNGLQTRVDQCMRKIRELGSLPSDAFDRFQSLGSKQLFRQLEMCNSELKKYSNVNKKALDQFVHFTEQKEKLQERKQEQERGYERIMELMAVLEQRKSEAIHRTFKQVSAYFSEVFSRLVAEGRGQLVMKTSRDDPNQSGVKDPNSVDTFTGVGIRVAFTSSWPEMREMTQLSGGQKSLVALALIFAIQKCDPAPFYLFDEIDQALDPTHRRSVAKMLSELSKKAQFITTTFRPELIEHADKFYGVKFRNKVSHVVYVSREEAHDFVEDDATHK